MKPHLLHTCIISMVLFHQPLFILVEEISMSFQKIDAKRVLTINIHIAHQYVLLYFTPLSLISRVIQMI